MLFDLLNRKVKINEARCVLRINLIFKEVFFFINFQKKMPDTNEIDTRQNLKHGQSVSP